MVRPKQEKKLKRIQMDLPVKAVERLKNLREKTDAASYAEVMRRALEVYEDHVSEKV